jgi:hypothetical protein
MSEIAWLRQLCGMASRHGGFSPRVAIALAGGFDDDSKAWPPADVVN